MAGLLSYNGDKDAKNNGSFMCNELKREIKYSRQVGCHVSPSVYVNGVGVDTSSGWNSDQWEAFLIKMFY